MRCRRAAIAVCLLVLTGVDLPAQSLTLEPPDPPALRPGVATTLHFETSARAARIWSGIPMDSSPGATNGPGLLLTVRTGVTAPGRFVLRLANTNGLSPWRIGLVDPLPAIIAPTNQVPELHPPVAVDGTVPAAGRRRFTVKLRRHEHLTVETVARRFGSLLDPRLRILNPEGRELVAIDDTPGLERDAWVEFIAPKAGLYGIEIADSLGDGGPRHRFRLRLHQGAPEMFPFLPVEGVVEPPPEVLRRITGSLAPDQLLPVPCTVKSAFTTAGRSLSFRFHTETNQTWRAEFRTRRLGSRADVGARFETAAGKVLAENDATRADDGSFSHTFAAAGEVRLVLTELSRASGPGYDVEFDLVPGQPDFRATLDREALELSPGGAGELKVTVARRGYDGPVDFSALALPGAFQLIGTNIPAKKNDGVVKVLAPTNAIAGSLIFFRLTASGDAGGRRFTSGVSTRSALRSAWPDLLSPPPGLDGIITIGVKAK